MAPNCIDVSSWQSGIDWQRVKAAGVRGIVKKAGYLALVTVGMVVDACHLV